MFVSSAVHARSAVLEPAGIGPLVSPETVVVDGVSWSEFGNPRKEGVLRNPPAEDLRVVDVDVDESRDGDTVFLDFVAFRRSSVLFLLFHMVC